MDAIDTQRQTAKSDSVRRQSAALLLEAGAGDAAHDASMLPVIAKAKGATVTDIDGNDYIDYDGGGGAALLGHADERITAAITKTAAKGHGFFGPSEPLVRLAELLVSRFAGIDGVRMAPTADEALHTAVALARRATGRNRLTVCERSFLARSRLRNAAAPAPDFIEVPYNDAAAAERILSGGGVAAFVVEPVATSLGLAIPVDGYLARIRALCDQFGALLIFDETRTGLRLGPGGAGALFGVVPDLVCLGGSLSAGLPLAVVGGRKDLLTIGAPGVNGCVEESYGTEIGVAAALAALQATADPAFYEQLDEHAATLERGLAESASAASVQLYLSRSCSLIGMYFTSGEVLNWDAAREVNTTRYGRFHGFMLDSGVLVPSSPHRPWAVSSAHTAEQIQVTVEAARDALARSA